MPKVSVIMTVRNGERFLREAVDSILNQTFRNFELIVVDDESTDGTGQMLAAYAAQDARVIIDTQPKRRGVAVCRNLGNQRATGEYLAVMDADDICLPERLEKQVAFLDRHPEMTMAGTFVEIVDEQGSRIGFGKPPTEPNVLRWLLCFLNPFPHSSMIMRREVALSLGGYRENIGAAEDYDLIARASVHAPLGMVPDVLVRYRDWGNSLKTRTKKELVWEVNRIMQLLAEDILHESVAEDAVNAQRLVAWNQPLESPAQIRVAAALLDRLYLTYTSTIDLSAQEAQAIAEDAAVRSYALGRRSLRSSPYYALTLGVKGLIRSPRSARKIITYYGRKVFH